MAFYEQTHSQLSFIATFVPLFSAFRQATAVYLHDNRRIITPIVLL
jgi:hypothetical protein